MKHNIPAMLLAAQMACGSARMVLDTQAHPGALKDDVCSPGGSTIEGVKVLENRDLAGTVMDCVKASFEKNKLLGK